MAFIKHTRAEKSEVVKPADNAKLNQKVAGKSHPTLEDVKKASGPSPDCDCPSPCSYCG